MNEGWNLIIHRYIKIEADVLYELRKWKNSLRNSKVGHQNILKENFLDLFDPTASINATENAASIKALNP